MYEAKRGRFELRQLIKRADETIPNCLLRSSIGFVGGTLLTYLCFIFFVCQLSISLVHATIMSSIIGLLLTLGLAFSNRIRCLVLLLIPQLFSRIGRYTLTCYALILILTGPATNTLKNSEVLTESMACSQEQVKSQVRYLSDSVRQPFNLMKDSVHIMIDGLDDLNVKLKDMVMSIERMVVSIADGIQSSYNWLATVVNTCNYKLGTPYEHCINILTRGLSDCKSALGPKLNWLCNVTKVEAACQAVKSYKTMCSLDEFAKGSFAATIKRKLRFFTNRMKSMFYAHIEIHHTYTVSNASRSASQVASGIFTEIRNKADPLITWLYWSSCVTCLFLMLIIFRAKYYQHMYETRSRYDNRYVTRELHIIDAKRLQEGRDTILPLNRRERTKYIPTTSFRLIACEKVFMSRSAVFMVITTFKLMIHIIADCSLFWVLTTIRQHGGLIMSPGPSDAGVSVTGSGFGADILRSIFSTLTLPLRPSSYSSCLPDPRPPDFRRYTQIGVIIVILWLLAVFEPYGLRLRHVIMGHHRPERAKARASWLYNHILRTRGSFMKLARRKLHREYKYHSEEHLTFRHWLDTHLPFYFLRYSFGTLPKQPSCLLCETIEKHKDPDTQLARCESQNCPGVFCRSCFADIGQLCTICLSPADYGDYSDISLEKGSDNERDDDYDTNECKEDSSKGYIRLQIAKRYNRDYKHYDRKYKENRRNNNTKHVADSEKSPLLSIVEGGRNEKSLGFQTYVLFNNYSTEQNCLKEAISKRRRVRQRCTRCINFKNVTLVVRKFQRILMPRRYYKIRRKSLKSKTELLPRMYAVIRKYWLSIMDGEQSSKPIKCPRSARTKCMHSKGWVKNLCTREAIKRSTPKKLVLDNIKDSKKDTDRDKLRNNKKAEHVKMLPKIKNKKRSLYTRTMCVAFATCLKLNCWERHKVNEAIQESSTKKDSKDFKKRKKKQNEELKQQVETTRDYRIAAYLQDESWVKGILRKESLKDRIKTDYALNQLARCQLYANKDKAAKKVIKDTSKIAGMCCKSPQTTHITSKQEQLKDSEPKIKHKAETSEESKKMKFLKFCRRKKHTVQNVLREEASSTSWGGSDLIKTYDYDDECKFNRQETEQNCSKRLDFYRCIGDEFQTIGKRLSNESSGFYKQSNEINSDTSQSDKDMPQKDKTKCFRIKDLKLIFSDHFLHLRIKNPALFKDFYTHIAQLTDLKKKYGNNKKVTKEKALFIPVTTEKGVTGIPILQSRSCQCVDIIVQDRGTQMRCKSHAATEKYSSNKDCSEVGNAKCSCATQYGCIHDTAGNSTFKLKSAADRISNSNDTDTSLHSNSSVYSDETKTDTTICSRIEIDYVEERPRMATVRRVKKIKVTSKTNQATSTNETTLCDVSTLTEDWWSPLNERKPIKRVRESGDYKHRKRNKGVATDRRYVQFHSRAHIIPDESYDILSPSRYLLESQKYYNELFSSPRVYAIYDTKRKKSDSYNPNRNGIRKNRRIKRLDEPVRLKGIKELVGARNDETSRSIEKFKTKLRKT